MYRLLVILSCILSALAFNPAGLARYPSARSVFSLGMNYEDAIGAQPPLGFWDPLGLLKDADQERFDRLRYVETKHGRISMLAILGHLVTTAGYRLPGEIAFGLPFSKIPAGEAALFVIPPAGLAQIFFFIGLLEVGFGARQIEIEEAQLEASGWDAETIDRKVER